MHWRSWILPLPALHNPFLPEYSSCSLSLSPDSSLFLRPSQLHHTIHFYYLTQISLHLLLSPNQFPYKCKKRSTETNFVSHSSVTSVMLCPQADIYNSRTIGLITSAKDKFGRMKKHCHWGKRNVQCCMACFWVCLSCKNVRLYRRVFILSYILYHRWRGRGVDYPPHTSPRLTMLGATPTRYSCVFIKCHRENFSRTMPWFSIEFYLIFI
jgi:hypothetical protein